MGLWELMTHICVLVGKWLILSVFILFPPPPSQAWSTEISILQRRFSCRFSEKGTWQRRWSGTGKRGRREGEGTKRNGGRGDKTSRAVGERYIQYDHQSTARQWQRRVSRDLVDFVCFAPHLGEIDDVGW